MKIIDRIALSRALKILVDLIIRLVELFNKSTTIEKEPESKPKRKKILPWRNNDK